MEVARFRPKEDSDGIHSLKSGTTRDPRRSVNSTSVLWPKGCTVGTRMHKGMNEKQHISPRTWAPSMDE